LRFFIKLPFTSTAFIGEITDLILGLAFVIPTIAVYNKFKNQSKIETRETIVFTAKNSETHTIIKDMPKTKKLWDKSYLAAIYGTVVGIVSVCFCAIVINKLFVIDSYVALYIGYLPPELRWEEFLNWFRELYPNITQYTFYRYYLWLAILPFNLLKFGLCGIISILLYKPVTLVYKLKLGKKKTIVEPIISTAYTEQEIDQIFAQNIILQANQDDNTTINNIDNGDMTSTSSKTE